jgi:hypothetical protein
MPLSGTSHRVENEVSDLSVDPTSTDLALWDSSSALTETPLRIAPPTSEPLLPWSRGATLIYHLLPAKRTTAIEVEPEKEVFSRQPWLITTIRAKARDNSLHALRGQAEFLINTKVDDHVRV